MADTETPFAKRKRKCGLENAIWTRKEYINKTWLWIQEEERVIPKQVPWVREDYYTVSSISNGRQMS